MGKYHRYTPKIPEPVTFRFFLVIKITAVRQVRMSLHLPRSKHEDKTCVKRYMADEDREHIGFAFVFACAVGKTPKTPKLNLMADEAITQGGIGGLGSLVYICGKYMDQ